MTVEMIVVVVNNKQTMIMKTGKKRVSVQTNRFISHECQKPNSFVLRTHFNSWKESVKSRFLDLSSDSELEESKSNSQQKNSDRVASWSKPPNERTLTEFEQRHPRPLHNPWIAIFHPMFLWCNIIRLTVTIRPPKTVGLLSGFCHCQI